MHIVSTIFSFGTSTCTHRTEEHFGGAFKALAGGFRIIQTSSSFQDFPKLERHAPSNYFDFFKRADLAIVRKVVSYLTNSFQVVVHYALD